MIAPTRILAACCGLLAMLGLLAGFAEMAGQLWIVVTCILIGVGLVDLLLSLKRPRLEVGRSLHASLPVTARAPVTIRLESQDSRRLHLLVHDIHPQGWSVKKLPVPVVLAPNQFTECKYTIRPSERGDFSFTGVDLVLRSPLGLWQKKWFFPCKSNVKVFPNFREISHYTLLATHHHLSMMGIKKQLRRGEGKEFHQLREYRQGDELQKIDWKATSRIRKLISKEYQDERDQQVVFVLDSGRRMGHVEAGKSHLDQALNSILLLGYVAYRQGDSVGLYSFGGTQKWHPPRKESGSARSLLFAAYDIQSATNASDYLKATQDMLALQQRRSLMVIITNSRSEDYDDLLQMVRQLRHKHLVVIADLRESILDQTVTAPIQTFDDALRYQALQNYLIQRKTLFQQLTHLGVLVLDVTADQLPTAVVNTYLEVKSSGRL